MRRCTQICPNQRQPLNSMSRTIIRICLMMVILMTATWIVTSCTYPRDGPIEKLGDPSTKSGLIVFFKRGSTAAEIYDFDRFVISSPDQAGRGYQSLPGIISVVRFNRNGFAGKQIDFRLNATAEQKKYVRSQIEQSPIVLRIFEETALNDIPDLR